jgi:tetratricopeptide (TPR) repeat protein
MYQGERYGHIAPDIVADNAHNYELQIATGTGMVGFLFFAALVIYVFFEGLRVIYQRTFTDKKGIHYESTETLAGLGVNLGLLLSFLAYFFQLITSVSVIGSTLMWWLAFAGILSQGVKLRETILAPSGIFRLLLIPVVLILISVFIYFNTAWLIADHYYFLAKGATGYPAFIFEQEGLIKKAMQLNPWQWDYPAEMARSFFLAYKYTNNKDFLERSLYYALLAEEIDNYEADIKALLTQIYLEKSQYDSSALAEAEAVAAKMTELMPHHYVSWLLLGQCYYLENRLQEAIQAFEEAIRNNPRSAQSYYLLAKCYERLGNKELYVQYLKKAKEIDPNIDK